MLLYSIIMLLVGALFAIISILIYKGKTDLIHSYHQTKVSDKRAYGKAFGKALALFPAGMTASGVLALFGENELFSRLSLIALFIGMLGGIIGIVIVQKKYNNGIF